MHLEKEILQGKAFKRGELRKEATEELKETPKGKKVLRSLIAKKMDATFKSNPFAKSYKDKMERSHIKK